MWCETIRVSSLDDVGQCSEVRCVCVELLLITPEVLRLYVPLIAFGEAPDGVVVSPEELFESVRERFVCGLSLLWVCVG